MKTTAVLLLCALIPITVSAGDTGYNVKYDGGSVTNVKAGNGLKLFIEGNQIRIVKDKGDVATIPASSVTEISYGQDVHRRVGTAVAVAVFSFGIGALTALSKSKKHFIGLTWANGDLKGGFAMRCDKNDYRGILAGLEGVTGKKAVDSDALNVKNELPHGAGWCDIPSGLVLLSTHIFLPLHFPPASVDASRSVPRWIVRVMDYSVDHRNHML